jgi:hypothetical protein
MALNPTLDSTQNPTLRSAQNLARISTRNTMPKMVGLAGGLLVCLTLAAGIAGCRVQVDKGANGEQKKVQVDTPFGGIHVNTDQTSAADLGLPTYPGANIVNDKDNEKSADIHMGFGEWELRVKVVNFSTPDSQDKVVAFYKNALMRYGDVITCQGTTSVGTPTETSEGLTCADDKNNTSTVQIDRGDYGSGENSLELKAGSKRHQHIVGFNTSASGQTRFALVALDLPAGATGSGKSD